ncbi:TetR/AcrR family transcriptional regulator C-terminal domain-containing protein [Streptomyces sp. 15-116A]|uniref:TetR/AcrR family transcriptional regulator C-terminal domain-containing protein n=1 Tax=Streptomyces sp. 15-116A TaxID=2259035 RepID=UPI0021B1A128|nr:TetR/AcrR family transcriptional regulator C-terminal domain-containing protein [Streptomyces sp. 15-116A]MCT7351009.1 TetR/AcrR family transcriptional regulator C-terminal domain-containing protein [Streptomyces sp. 15-116A]
MSGAGDGHQGCSGPAEDHGVPHVRLHPHPSRKRVLDRLEKGGDLHAGQVRVAAAVFTYVLGNAAAALTRKVSKDGADAKEQLEQAMAKAREIGLRCPRLRARLETTAAAEYAASPEQTFEAGLHALLDGLARRIEG